LKYNLWSYRHGLLIVEKFSGTFKIDQIRGAENLIVGNRCGQRQKFRVLSDLTTADFPDVYEQEIDKVLKTYDENIELLKGMKMAVLANESLYDEFLKANSFALAATKRPITVMIFHSILSAFEWLEITKKEQKNIIKDLGNF